MKDGILYCNDGDWVENCTSVVESHDGWLEVLHWADRQQTMKSYRVVGDSTAAA